MIGNINIMDVLEGLETKINIIKSIFIILCTYYTDFKITNKKYILDIRNVIFNIIIITLCVVIKCKANYFASIVCVILLQSLMFSKDNIGYSILATIMSLSINYIIFSIAIAINYGINFLMGIDNNCINLIIIIMIHLIILYSIFRIKRFKYGISFLKNKQNNEFINLFVLNASAIILFEIIIIVNADIRLAIDATAGLIVIAIIMFVTIQKTLQLYYKEKLLIQDLNETKEELEKTKSELKQVEDENLGLSKKSHSIAHKQKALEYGTVINKCRNK